MLVMKPMPVLVCGVRFAMLSGVTAVPDTYFVRKLLMLVDDHRFMIRLRRAFLNFKKFPTPFHALLIAASYFAGTWAALRNVCSMSRCQPNAQFKI